MENTYSITVTNKFCLALDEDEDPLEVLKVREQEKEAKKREKQSEKENKSKLPEGQKSASAGNKPPKSRVIKDVAQTQPSKNQDNKKDQGEKKPAQPRTGAADRNVKFSGESQEERLNRRNREDGEKPPRRDNQVDARRGPPGEGRNTRDFRGDGPRERGDRPERGNRQLADRGDRGNREPGDRNDRGPRERVDRAGERGERVERGDREDRGERSGPRGGRGGGQVRVGSRGRGSFDNRGKREYDRQSGSDKTGVKPVDKKDGAGSHNWGTHNDEIEESLNQETEEYNNEKPDGDTPMTVTEGKEGEAPVENSSEEKPAEEEARELTLDEWKALRSQRAKPQFNVRKAGEGEDPSRWKKMYALEKKKEGVEGVEEEEEEDYDAAAEYPQRVGRQKRVLGIEINFSDNRRRSGARGNPGGRGGGRVERPGGGRNFGNRGPPRDAENREPRGPAPAAPVEQRSPRGGRQNAPKVYDEHDFPSLG